MERLKLESLCAIGRIYETHVRYFVLEEIDGDDEIISTSLGTFACASGESAGKSVKR